MFHGLHPQSIKRPSGVHTPSTHKASRRRIFECLNALSVSPCKRAKKWVQQTFSQGSKMVNLRFTLLFKIPSKEKLQKSLYLSRPKANHQYGELWRKIRWWDSLLSWVVHVRSIHALFFPPCWLWIFGGL